jgi:predicted permease
MYLHDLAYALRTLAARPLYAIVTVLVLALAIGANVTVFSVFNGLFLKPLPYVDDDRLVIVYNTYPGLGLENAGTSIPDYLDRREQAPSLADLAIHTRVGAPSVLGEEGAPLRLVVVRASPSLFTVLGVSPLYGRTFTEGEATLGSESVVVLSHRLWTAQFGGAPDMVGRDIRLDGQPYRVIGVMPRHFGFPNADVDAWMPFAFTPEQTSDQARGNEFSASIGRLAPGATLERLNAEFDAIVQRNAERLGATETLASTGFTGQAQYLRESQVGDLRQILLVLQACVLAVLLIAGANIANLQLARMAARRKELTVRAVLGARRRRLVALVLAEAFLLGAMGALLGLVLAHAGLELVRTLGLDRAAHGYAFALDLRVLLFTLGAALSAAMLSTLLPLAMLLRENPAQVIQEAGRLSGGGRGGQRFRNALVVVQVAMSVALLVGAGLLTKSFYELQQSGTGFDARNVVTAQIALPQSRYGDPESVWRVQERALEELRALPGVAEASLTSVVPFSGNISSSTLDIDGYTPADGTSAPHADLRTVSDRYLETLRIPVNQGRGFALTEPERVAIVDENMAHRYWPDGDVLGQRLRPVGMDEWFTIVGVVPAIKHRSLAEVPVKETVYFHFQQLPVSWASFMLRTSLAPAQLERPARDAITRIDPDLPLFGVRPLEARVAASLGPQRTPMVLTLAFAGIAFTLAVVGVYGVLTWAVTQRFGEIGVRMALGASGRDIQRLVISQGVRLIALGVSLGIVAAFALARLASTQIHQVSMFDPMIFGGVVVGLSISALIASWLPARRAAHIDPIRALGYQ